MELRQHFMCFVNNLFRIGIQYNSFEKEIYRQYNFVIALAVKFIKTRSVTDRESEFYALNKKFIIHDDH